MSARWVQSYHFFHLDHIVSIKSCVAFTWTVISKPPKRCTSMHSTQTQLPTGAVEKGEIVLTSDYIQCFLPFSWCKWLILQFRWFAPSTSKVQSPLPEKSWAATAIVPFGGKNEVKSACFFPLSCIVFCNSSLIFFKNNLALSALVMKLALRLNLEQQPPTSPRKQQ